MGDSTLLAQDAPPSVNRRLIVFAAAGAALILSIAGTAAVMANSRETTRWQVALAGEVEPPPPTPAPTVKPEPPGDTVTLSGVGDIIMGTLPGSVPPNGGQGFFDPVKKLLEADLVMGNLETPLTADTGRVKCGWVTPTPAPGNPNPSPVKESGCHQFYLPPAYANHLRDAGFHLVTLANNHTHDMGMAGLKNTRTALDSAGIKHTGAPDQIAYADVKGVKVAVIGVAIYSWTQSLNNIEDTAALVKEAAGQADLVVIQMQGGAEGADKAHVKPGMETFYGENRGDLIKFSHAMVDAGADVVFGHGPHVMRGMEFYQGRLIAYSLGNFAGYKVLSANGNNGVGGILKVTLRKDGTFAGGELIPTRMLGGGYAKPDSQKKAIPFVAGLSRDDFGANAARIAADGTITPPA